MSKKLTKAELMQIELNVKDQQLIEKELEIVSHKKTIELLNIKIKQLDAQVQLNNIDKEIAAKKEKLNQAKVISREYNNKLKVKYKLKEGWGINPDTGLILEEE